MHVAIAYQHLGDASGLLDSHVFCPLHEPPISSPVKTVSWHTACMSCTSHDHDRHFPGGLVVVFSTWQLHRLRGS